MFPATQPMAVAIAVGDVDFGITAITGGLIGLSEMGASKGIGGAVAEVEGIGGQKCIVSNGAHATRLTDLSGVTAFAAVMSVFDGWQTSHRARARPARRLARGGASPRP